MRRGTDVVARPDGYRLSVSFSLLSAGPHPRGPAWDSTPTRRLGLRPSCCCVHLGMSGTFVSSTRPEAGLVRGGGPRAQQIKADAWRWLPRSPSHLSGASSI